MSDENQDRSLRQIMDDAETALNGGSGATEVATRPEDYARPMPPQEGPPVQAAETHRNISIYGEAYATFLERSGDEVFAAASDYKDYCYQAANAARSETKAEAERAASFIEHVRRRAKILDRIRKVKS